MVEAGILAPVFAMMMMMTVYLGGVYEAKYRSVMLARYATFSYAANDCTNAEFHPDVSDFGPGLKGGQQTALNGGSSSTPPPGVPGPVPGVKGGSNTPPGTAQATTGIFSSHGQSTVSWIYGATARFNGNQPNVITTQGEMLCNTPPNQHMNIISYISNLVRMF